MVNIWNTKLWPILSHIHLNQLFTWVLKVQIMREDNQMWHFRRQPIEQHSTMPEKSSLALLFPWLAARSQLYLTAALHGWVASDQCAWKAVISRVASISLICRPAQENYTFVQRLGRTFIFLCSFVSTLPSSEEKKFQGALNSCITWRKH